MMDKPERKPCALLEQGKAFQTSWERIQEATLVSEALYRLRPELREEEGQLFEALHGNSRLPLGDPKHRESQARYEAISKLKQELKALARLPPKTYADRRAHAATHLGIDQDRIDAEVAALRDAVPAGLPLVARERYPDILDAREIAGLLSDDPEIRENYYEIIAAATAKKELVSIGVSMGSELDPNLFYKAVTRRLGALEQEVRGLLQRVEELQYQNAVLRSQIKGMEAQMPRGRRGLLDLPSRPRSNGRRAVAYAVHKQWLAPMVHRDEFAQWLQTQGIAIPPKSRLQAWLAPSRRAPRTRVTNLRRAVENARDTLKVRKGGVEPSADELFDFLAQDDPTGVVVDHTDDKLVWEDTNGNLQDATRKTVANMLSKVKKAT